MSIDDPDTRFRVVKNDQGQFSIWPEFKEVPGGWKLVGFEGNKEECLDYVEKNWTDMRPQSLVIH